VREEFKKPVVAACSGLAASGAYYAAVAADQIYTNPGTLMGSIGVIMEFANLEKLYQWAKIERYSIKTGAYKDSGAEYRSMRDDERALFQNLANEVLAQFKAAVSEGRKLAPDIVDRYADGRVFTGQMAVRYGFADKVGTYTDALKALGGLTNLGDKPEVFSPPRKRPSFGDFFAEMSAKLSLTDSTIKNLGIDLIGKPLYILPSAIPSRGR
jgi:protease-4